MTTHELIQASPIFRGLSSSNLSFLESVGTEVELEVDRVIFEEDDHADQFYVITAGKVALEVSVHSAPPVLVETLGPGDLLGVSWLFAPYRWNWRARAVAATTLVAFHAESIRNRCESDADLALHLYRAVAHEAVRRLHATRVRLLDLYPGTNA